MKRIQRLERRAKEARAEWERACDYARRVTIDAENRFEYILFRSPARKRYERAMKALLKVGVKWRE